MVFSADLEKQGTYDGIDVAIKYGEGLPRNGKPAEHFKTYGIGVKEEHQACGNENDPVNFSPEVFVLNADRK